MLLSRPLLDCPIVALLSRIVAVNSSKFLSFIVWKFWLVKRDIKFYLSIIKKTTHKVNLYGWFSMIRDIYSLRLPIIIH